ncbi:hypothetical protein [Halomonas sp. PA16-9]|uniref:hypothetical protein n=1 Tax=Halomonas sp. PA16-9 TaxID=2576841 RepID=UPI0012DAB50C|nr:hypothetical protein FDY98_06500 [Halomonas sp. PA16-9]
MGNVVSFHKGIDRLTAENLIRIDKPVDEGIRALTQPCYLRWSDGTESQAYLKIFGSNLGTCIINEITGFLIGKACNLPLPNKLGMLQLPEDFVKANQCCEWAIAVSEVPGKTLKMIYKDVGVDSFAPIFDHLFEWSRIEDVLAFDDWIANGDRNIGNVVIAGSSSYYLIDHSDALVKSNWSIGDLDPSRQVDSVLAEGYRYNSRACSDKKRSL